MVLQLINFENIESKEHTIVISSVNVADIAHQKEQ